MSLKDRYQIPENIWKEMIRDGVLPCAIKTQEEILSCLKKHIETGITHGEAVKRTSDDMRVSTSWVYEVINRWG